MIIIEVNNNQCQIRGELKQTRKVYECMKLRNPNAFHLRKYMPRGWDGKIEYIKSSGKFETGLLPRVISKIDELGFKYKLIDNRHIEVLEKAKLRKRLKGDEKLRADQWPAVQAVLDSKAGNIIFPRCALKVATNGGKTYISAGIYNAYREPTIFVMNSKELFVDALRDMPKLLDCKIGYIGNGKIVPGDFMICMVKSLQNKLHDPWVKKFLARCTVGIWDEGDLANNKTNKACIKASYNCIVRVALSGTWDAGPKVKKTGLGLKKDEPKLWDLEALFGPQVFAITNRELINLGISSEVEVKFIKGNTKNLDGYNYVEQVNEGIINNKSRNKKIIKRILYHLSKGRDQQLIILQRHKHIKKVFKLLTKQNLDLTIDWVHHSRKDRFEVTQNFMDGKIDILIGSMILKRGKNFKKMKYMLNAGGGKSPENILQLLGRAFRGCEHMEDMWDEGLYLKRHSRRRDIYYRNENIKVINNYKTIKK